VSTDEVSLVRGMFDNRLQEQVSRRYNLAHFLLALEAGRLGSRAAEALWDSSFSQSMETRSSSVFHFASISTSVWGSENWAKPSSPE
jgi:hypothetical protein